MGVAEARSANPEQGSVLVGDRLEVHGVAVTVVAPPSVGRLTFFWAGHSHEAPIQQRGPFLIGEVHQLQREVPGGANALSVRCGDPVVRQERNELSFAALHGVFGDVEHCGQHPIGQVQTKTGQCQEQSTSERHRLAPCTWRTDPWCLPALEAGRSLGLPLGAELLDQPAELSRAQTGEVTDHAIRQTRRMTRTHTPF